MQNAVGSSQFRCVSSHVTRFLAVTRSYSATEMLVMRPILSRQALLLLAFLALLAGSDASAQQLGSIEGEVDLKIRQSRRSAPRYPGRRSAAHEIQRIAAVAFIRGPVAGAPATTPSMYTIAQSDTAFVPSLLVVPVGSEVSFPNGDPFFHNVFSYSSTERFDLGRYPRGESKEVLFEEPGIVDVFCEVHEFMRSAVVVVESPYHAIVGDDDRFSIGDVPPGEYTLVIWHADLGTVEQPITVTAGGTVRVSVELG